jgi:protease-4
MKVNHSLMDIANAQWLMSRQGIDTYAGVFHKIITGQDVNFEKSTKSILTVVDDNGKRVSPGSNGLLDVPKGSVAIVDMIGPVLKYGDWWNYGALEIVAALQAADNNPNIIGTVFNVDSPGGAVSAIGPFIEFGKTKKKPVVAIVDQCASLGFWAACTVADHKMASNTISASIGSVGVVLSYIDTRKYLETLGYVFHEVYPDESEHKNESWTLMMQGKYDLIKKEMLSPLALKFQEAIRAACPNLKEEIGVLTGKTFGAEKALEYGMIDAIGSIDQAIQRLHVMSETNHYK